VLADRHPGLVDHVVALGSPVADPYDVHPLTLAAIRAAFVVNRLEVRTWFADESSFLEELVAPPRRPVISIFSRTDGIVNWRACLRSDMESLEVRGSHVGLALNVYRLLGGRLVGPARAA